MKNTLNLIFFLGIIFNCYCQNFVVEYNGFYRTGDSLKALPVNYKLEILKDSISLFSNAKMKDSIIGRQLDRNYYKLDKKKTYFYDVKNQNFSLIKSSSGNPILLTNAKVYEWKLTKDSKVINGFECYKAFGKALPKLNFGKLNGTVENGYSIEVWYCPKFNVPFGPANYIDLPGLVFQAKNKRGFMYKIKSIRNVNTLDINFEKIENTADYVEYYKRVFKRFGGK